MSSSLRASGRLLACIAFMLSAAARGQVLEGNACAAQEHPWRVVILNDGDPAAPAFVTMERAMRQVLAAPGRHRVDLFHENLDMLRFPEALFESELVALLAKKYVGMSIDAVIAIGTPSLDFAEKHRGRLWPAARVLFQGVPVEVLRERSLGTDTIGWPTQHDLAGVAELALRLRPSTRHLIVISGSGDFDRRMALVAKTQLEPYAKRLGIEYWQEVSLEEFLRRVARLGRDDAVLYLAVGRDISGRTFVIPDVARQISAASKAPVYGPFETFMGQGIVGGTMYSFEERGERMGHLVHEVLSSPRGQPGRVLDTGPSTCVVDARQLGRFAMRASDLPGGCELRFMPPSLWREYRWYILGALLVILAQAALILALVLQRRARVRAED